MILVSWILVALIFAYRRSLWADEWNHVQDLKNGLWWATREMLHKPSPFSPGEVFLNWLPETLLSPLQVPLEIWARVQGIAWGAGAVATALSLATDRKALRFLPLFIFFSTALLSFSIEMRPYSSLYFSGALVAKILWDGGVKGRLTPAALWVQIFCGHLYGVCFVMAALFLTSGFREYKKMLVATAYLAFIFSQIKIVVGQGISPLPTATDMARQIAGVLGNPHKASYVFLPLAALGGAALFRSHRRLALQIMTALVVMTAGPLLATILGKYFFVPRQVAAGSFLFLILCALGFEHLSQRLPRLIPAVVALTVSVVPWTLSSVLKIPPFPNQPFHRFRELAQDLVTQKKRSILNLDVCNAGPLKDYLERALKQQPAVSRRFQHAGFVVEQTCWSEGTCFSTLVDMKYCSTGVTDFAPPGKGAPLFEQAHRYDAVVHAFFQPLILPPQAAGIVIVRDW